MICIDASESASYIFNSFLRCFEQRRRTERIVRFGVHVCCSDGLARVPFEIERAVVAGWMHVARLLAPGGFVCFSVAVMALAETKLLQYPWTVPSLFCMDPRNYEQMGSVPSSTPLNQHLKYFPANASDRPSGRLINSQRVSSKRRPAGTSGLPLSEIRTNAAELSLFEAIEVLTSY